MGAVRGRAAADDNDLDSRLRGGERMEKMSFDFEGKRVYLSGPVTNKEGWNKEAFDEAERRLRELGASHVFNPVRNVPLEGHEKPHAHYMLLSLHCLTQHLWDGDECKPAFDCVVLLPGWDRSAGARTEHDAACACGIQCVMWAEAGKRAQLVAKDGLPIEVGQTLFGEDGERWLVTEIRHGGKHAVVGLRGGVYTKRYLKPEWLTHEKPDGELRGKCSECTVRKGYCEDAETIRGQQEHIASLTLARDAYLDMAKCVQRDCDARDELVRDLYDNLWTHVPKCAEAFAERMRELGIEVDG